MLQHCWKWLQIHLTGSGRWRWNNIVISEYICCARFLIRAGWLGSFPYTIGLNYQGPSQWVSCQTLKQTRLKMDCFHSGREVSEKLFIIIAKWVLWYRGVNGVGGGQILAEKKAKNHSCQKLGIIILQKKEVKRKNDFDKKKMVSLIFLKENLESHPRVIRESSESSKNHRKIIGCP